MKTFTLQKAATGGWEIVSPKSEVSTVTIWGKTKAIAIGAARLHLKPMATKEYPISLRVRNSQNGRYQTEFTYPKSADPKKSKG